MAIYSATITYRPTGDTRPADRCPQVSLPARDTATARTRDVERTVRSLTHQPTEPNYEVLTVAYTRICGRCDGIGKLLVKPKGWRKRTAPPACMCQQVVCPECHGTPEVEEAAGTGEVGR